MDHEFCPECGHLLSRVANRCFFCGGSDRIDHFAYRGHDPETESDLVFGLKGAVCAEAAPGA